MLKPIAILVSCAVAAVAALAIVEPVEAKSARAKTTKVQSSQKVIRTTRVSKMNGGWDAFPGNPGFRDRTTINHPNGRLNGQEFFDSIADRAGDIGN